MTEGPGEIRPAERSPVFEEINRDRYFRQELIREIEEASGRRLIVYFSNTRHPSAAISQEDVAPFQDLLLDCAKGNDIDLLIQSTGGDPDVAEKLVSMLRQRAGVVRVIVVERAKSAATMVALAADEILMSTTSELGPIDPQIQLVDAQGQPQWLPAKSVLDGLEAIKRSIDADGGMSPAYYPLLSNLNPALIDFCSKSIQRSREYAEKWLKRHMLCGDPGKAEEIARKLSEVEDYRSHTMAIGAEDAAALGLKVCFMEPDDQLWSQLWRLYLAYEVRATSGPAAKTLESRKISIAW
jgi:hypothetical protein